MRAVLGDVADEDGRDVAGLGHPDQRGRDLLDLGDTAGDAVEVGGGDGLDRVDDEQLGTHLLEVGEHGAEVGLGGEVEQLVDPAGAVGAQPDLGGRLLAGDVEGAALVAGGLGGDLEQQRALADAGLAGEQDRGARDQPAAEHPVELGHPAAAERRLLDRHLADRHGRVGSTGVAAARVVGAATSATEPQAWHSPQRPTHFAVSQPHSMQR